MGLLTHPRLLHGQCISHKNDARLTAVAVNLFNMIQLVVDPKGGVRSEPFKNHFTRRKNHTDRYPTDAADPAYVFVPPQLKYAQPCSSPFHTTFILTKQKSTRAILRQLPKVYRSPLVRDATRPGVSKAKADCPGQLALDHLIEHIDHFASIYAMDPRSESTC